MKKIIHFSDLHIGCTENDGAVSLTRNFDDRIKYLTTNIDDPKEHIIVVTGDIAHNANEDDFQYAKDAFDSLEKDLGFRVLVVPGNHDYRVKEGISGELKESTEARDVFCKVFYGGNVTFPKEDVIDVVIGDGSTRKIVFIGIDSNAEQLEGSKGKIGTNQLEDLEKKLRACDSKQCYIKIVYLHHNPYYHKVWSLFAMKLMDRKEFKDLLSKYNVSLLLYGHTHTHSFKINKKQVTLSIDGGTTTGRKGNKTPARIIDFLTIDYEDIEEFEKEDIETHFDYIPENSGS